MSPGGREGRQQRGGGWGCCAPRVPSRLQMPKAFHHSELSQAAWPQARGESNAAEGKT